MIAINVAEWVTIGGSVVTAIATVALVVVTFLYVKLTQNTTTSAVRSAEASERAAEAATEAVELSRRALLLNSTPFVTGVETARHGEEWTLKLVNQGGGTAINPEAWIEVDGVTFALAENRIIPRARYAGPVEKGSSTTLSTKGPANVADGVDIAVVVRFSDKSGYLWETANHRFGPRSGKIDTSLDGARDPSLPRPSDG